MEDPPKPDATLPLKGARVLVVEDDFFILMDLESILTAAGAEVVGPCRTVKDAMPLAERDGLSAAILDIQLEHETVEPVARKLCSRDVPFIFYTGQTETDPIREEWPDHKIVIKPAQPRFIINAIAELVKR
jgi:DNA-binding response OmpR family regulator